MLAKYLSLEEQQSDNEDSFVKGFACGIPFFFYKLWRAVYRIFRSLCMSKGRRYISVKAATFKEYIRKPSTLILS